jgi:putative Mn2+ efflux pump MntP
MWDRVGSAVLFGLAANTDNVSVGLAYGLKRRRIGWRSNLLIAGITTLVTLIALAGGLALRAVLPPKVPDALGGSLLLVLAAWSFCAERRGAGGSSPRLLRRFAPRPRVGLVETLFLAATLSINNIGLALAGGIGGVDYRAAALAIGGFSVAMLALGQGMGSNVLRVRLPPLARSCLNGNVVLALAGLFMLAGH